MRLRNSVALAVFLTLSFPATSINSASASELEIPPQPSEDIVDFVDSASEKLGGDDSARSEVASFLGDSAIVHKTLEDLVPSSIDSDIVEALLADDTFNQLPSDFTTGAASIPRLREDGTIEFSEAPEGGSSHVQLLGAQPVEREGTAVISRSLEQGAKAVSHVTEENGGQIVAIAESPGTRFIDFTYDLPPELGLRASDSGGAEIVDANAEVVGLIEDPWAIDAKGQHVQTSFDFSTEGLIRQRISPNAHTEFPVAVDPSWKWWTASVLKCAAEIAITFTPGKVAKIGASLVNIAKKSAKARKAISSLGGTKKAVVSIVKKAANNLKSKTRKFKWSKKLPSYRLSSKQSKQSAVVLGFIGANAWEFFGLGSCGAIVKALKK